MENENMLATLGSPSTLFGKYVEYMFFPTGGVVVSCPRCKKHLKNRMAIIRYKDAEGNPVIFHLNCFAKGKNKSASTT